MAQSRSPPSSCEVEVRSFSGQCGQVSHLFSRSGGLGSGSSCPTERAPCRSAVPTQSAQVLRQERGLLLSYLFPFSISRSMNPLSDTVPENTGPS